MTHLLIKVCAEDCIYYLADPETLCVFLFQPLGKVSRATRECGLLDIFGIPISTNTRLSTALISPII